jgi:hypothetical protein
MVVVIKKELEMINEVAVKSLFDRYHRKVQTNPRFYTSARWGAVVVLPKELLGYANRLAGHSGYASTARPIGIRRAVPNPASFLKEVFSSVDSLRSFIMSSECDAEEYINEVKRRHSGDTSKKQAPAVSINNRPANEVFFEKYTINDAKALQNKFGRDMVIREFNILTINEFELRYGIN